MNKLKINVPKGRSRELYLLQLLETEGRRAKNTSFAAFICLILALAFAGYGTALLTTKVSYAQATSTIPMAMGTLLLFGFGVGMLGMGTLFMILLVYLLNKTITPWKTARKLKEMLTEEFPLPDLEKPGFIMGVNGPRTKEGVEIED